MEVSTTASLDTTFAPNATEDTGLIKFELHLIPVGILLLLIVLATIVGNTLVILAIYYEHCLRSVTNYFIVSLAVADMLLGVLVLPLSSAYEILGIWVFGNVLCTAWAAIDVLCCTASILNLVAISLDRYIAISRPMHYHTFATHKRVLAAIFSVWLLSVAVSIPPLFGWRAERTDPWQCELTSGMGYVIYSALGSYWIPLFIMLFVYGKIYHVAIEQAKQIQKGQTVGIFRERDSVDTDLAEHGRMYGTRKESKLSSSGSSLSQENIHEKKYKERVNIVKRLKRFSREARATRTLSIVIGAFVICWLPFFSVYLIGGVCEHCMIPEMLFKAFFWLGYCNSFLNPIIYPLMNKDFKRAFRKLVRRAYCRRHSITYFDNRGYPDGKPSRTQRRLRLSVPHGGQTPPESPVLNSRVSSPDQRGKLYSESKLGSIPSEQDENNLNNSGAIGNKEPHVPKNFNLEKYDKSPGKKALRSYDNVLMFDDICDDLDESLRKEYSALLRHGKQTNYRENCYSEPNLPDFDDTHSAFDLDARRKSSLSNNDISMLDVSRDSSTDSTKTRNQIRQPKDRPQDLKSPPLILSVSPPNGIKHNQNEKPLTLTFDKNSNSYADSKASPISKSLGDCTCNDNVNNNILNELGLRFIDDGTSSQGEPDVTINAVQIFRSLSQKHMHTCS